MKFLLAGLSGLLLTAVGLPPLSAAPVSLDEELLEIQQSWAQANYATVDDDAKKVALQALSQRTAALSQRYPGRAEPLIWEGIVLSTYAGAKGGFGALGIARQSREKLEAALKIDPKALDGSAYTSLGALYYKVPGFPLGFGDRHKAETYLRKALELSPAGIDANYFYGEFLFEEERYPDALTHLQAVLNAPARAHRELADSGRRKQAAALIARTRSKIG